MHLTPPSNFLLIPGFMCDDSLWQYLAPELERSGRVQLANLMQGDSIEAMAERISADMPDQCIVLGFSMGGYVARQIALSTPQKVAGLILLNTSARATSAAELQHNRQLIEVSKNANFKGQPLRAFQRALHPDRMQQAEQAGLLAQLQAMSTNLGNDVFRRQLSVIRDDGHASLAQIGCPTLVIGSRNDQMRTVEESENLAKGIRHSSLAIIEDCGHMSPLEKPSAVLELIQQWRASKLIA
jgi:pimeloyl-ACP methyl ester carboxylesterase